MQNFFVDKNIAKAKTLDTSFYNDPELFEKMKEKLFASSWQFIGDAGYVKEHGDVYPFTLLENYLDEPLVITRDKEDLIHLLSNVCTHRGNIVADKPCKTNNHA
jgi:choline monooxygenase